MNKPLLSVWAWILSAVYDLCLHRARRNLRSANTWLRWAENLCDKMQEGGEAL